jgi:hypothetical protein
LEDLDKRLVRLVSLTARVEQLEVPEECGAEDPDSPFGDDFREGGAVLLPRAVERPDVIDRNVISDTLHVRLPSRADEHRPGLVRAVGRPAPPREPERQGIQERQTGRLARFAGRASLAAVAPDHFDEV